MSLRFVVTGGAGFIGSHLCETLVAQGHEVVAVDNLITGDRRNVSKLAAPARFRLVEADVSDGIPVEGPVHGVLHLASPASPFDYLNHPLETLRVGADGTRNALELARRHDAPFLLASTSEVYGDPAVHPQTESYWGNVNPIGPRSVYDEAKRYGEALTMAYHRTHGVRTRIARIFNTYGPRMRPNDGRAIPTFLDQARAGRPLTVFGDGKQTRSFCFVDDLVRGLLALFERGGPQPVNLGNPHETTLLELAETVLRLTGASSPVVHAPLPEDDPRQRRPDITRARETLGWSPKIGLEEGLRLTIAADRGRT